MLAPSCNCRVIAQAVGLRTRNARWLEGFFYDSLVGDRHHNSIGEITPDEMLSGKENAIREESVIRLDDSQYAFENTCTTSLVEITVRITDWRVGYARKESPQERPAPVFS